MARLAFLLCLIFFSLICANAQEGKSTYSIQGKLSGLEDSTIILLFDPYTFDGAFEKDTALLMNGEYEFVGILKNPQQVAITYSNSAEEFIFWLDTGVTIIDSERGNLRKSTYSGSSIPALIDQYKRSSQRYMDSLQVIYLKHKNSLDTAESAFWVSECNRFEDSVLQSAIQVILDYPRSYYAVITLVRIRFQLPVEKFDELFLVVNEHWSGSYGEEVLTQFRNERNALKTGDVIWDFSMIGEDGELEKLSKFKGNYIYLDFWASYCAPCLKKMPYLDSLQTRSDSTRFVIVSLSLDYKADKWKSTMTRYNVCFNNFLVPTDDNMLRNRFSDVFGLASIPRTFLLGPDLSLILVDPTEKELEEYLKDKGLLVW